MERHTVLASPGKADASRKVGVDQRPRGDSPRYVNLVREVRCEQLAMVGSSLDILQCGKVQ